MKKFFLTLGIILASTLIIISLNKSEELDIEFSRQDMIGSWKLTNKSAKENRKDNDIVQAFTLKEDSTAIVQYNNSIEKELDGVWKVKAKKELGKSIIKISFETDVVISYWKTENHFNVLGLKLKEKNNKLYLSAGKGEFEKL